MTADAEGMFLRRIIFGMALLGAVADTSGALILHAAEKPVAFGIHSAYATAQEGTGSIAAGLAKKILRATDNLINIKISEPGDVVQSNELLTAVLDEKIDAAFASPALWVDRAPVFGLLGGAPFGLTPGESATWLARGGGKEVWNLVYADLDVVSLPCGIGGQQGSGWFRRDIVRVQDIKGWKIRAEGLARMVLERLEADPQTIAPGEILPALQSGALDGAMMGPLALDLKLGLHQGGRIYYPSLWRAQAQMFELLVGGAKWRSLSSSQRAAFELACGDTIRESLADSDLRQARAQANLAMAGIRPAALAHDVTEAMEKAWNTVAAEQSEASIQFRRIYKSQADFMATIRGGGAERPK